MAAAVCFLHLFLLPPPLPPQTGGADGIKAAWMSPLKSSRRDERSSDLSFLHHLLPPPSNSVCFPHIHSPLPSSHQQFYFHRISSSFFSSSIKVWSSARCQSQMENDSNAFKAPCDGRAAGPGCITLLTRWWLRSAPALTRDNELGCAC